MTDRLYRSRHDKMIAGVAGGVAEMLDADPSLIRIVWAMLVFLTGGIALIVYIVMAIVVPERPVGMPVASAAADSGAAAAGDPVPEGAWRAPDGSTVPLAGAAEGGGGRRTPADRTRGGLIAGLLLIVIGGFFLVRQFVPSVDVSLWWPTLAIGAGLLILVLALLPPRRSN